MIYNCYEFLVHSLKILSEQDRDKRVMLVSHPFSHVGGGRVQCLKLREVMGLTKFWICDRLGEKYLILSIIVQL